MICIHIDSSIVHALSDMFDSSRPSAALREHPSSSMLPAVNVIRLISADVKLVETRERDAATIKRPCFHWWESFTFFTLALLVCLSTIPHKNPEFKQSINPLERFEVTTLIWCMCVFVINAPSPVKKKKKKIQLVLYFIASPPDCRVKTYVLGQ